jgi:hypothetical protein
MSGQALKVRGFWGALWHHRWWVLSSPGAYIVALAAAAAAYFVPSKQVAESLVPVATAELGIAAALVGVVLAGLAVLVVFLTEEYLELISQLPDPAERFDRIVFPFWLTSGLAVGAVILDLGVILTSDLTNDFARRALLGASTCLFLWALLGTMSLVGLIANHGGNRALQILLRRSSHRDKGCER